MRWMLAALAVGLLGAASLTSTGLGRLFEALGYFVAFAVYLHVGSARSLAVELGAQTLTVQTHGARDQHALGDVVRFMPCAVRGAPIPLARWSGIALQTVHGDVAFGVLGMSVEEAERACLLLNQELAAARSSLAAGGVQPGDSQQGPGRGG